MVRNKRTSAKSVMAIFLSAEEKNVWLILDDTGQPCKVIPVALEYQATEILSKTIPHAIPGVYITVSSHEVDFWVEKLPKA